MNTNPEFAAIIREAADAYTAQQIAAYPTAPDATKAQLKKMMDTVANAIIAYLGGTTDPRGAKAAMVNMKMTAHMLDHFGTRGMNERVRAAAINGILQNIK